MFQAPQKISFTFHYLTQVIHPWWCETCRVIQQQFWMKECDILGSKHTLIPPTYFQWVKRGPVTMKHYTIELECILNGLFCRRNVCYSYYWISVTVFRHIFSSTFCLVAFFFIFRFGFVRYYRTKPNRKINQ